MINKCSFWNMSLNVTFSMIGLFHLNIWIVIFYFLLLTNLSTVATCKCPSVSLLSSSLPVLCCSSQTFLLWSWKTIFCIQRLTKIPLLPYYSCIYLCNYRSVAYWRWQKLHGNNPPLQHSTLHNGFWLVPHIMAFLCYAFKCSISYRGFSLIVWEWGWTCF